MRLICISPEDSSLPSVSIFAITSSAMQLSPSFLMTWARTPAAGAGTSRTTLSVSISTRISSSSTACPGFLRHCRSVASATDSESCGTFTSISAILFAFLFLVSRSLGENEALQLSERLLEQRLLLLLVQVGVADRRQRRRRPAGVAEALSLAHVLVDVVLDEEPRALVLRLVLAPHDLAQARVFLELGSERLVRERIELLDADNRDVGVLAVGAGADEVVVDLARAGDQPLDAIGIHLGALLADDRPELALGELGERRARVLGAQQRLGRHDDQRLPEHAHHLATQDVEDLARRRRLDDLHVVVGRELHEALEARRRVLGALTLVAVRQHERQAVRASPLDFARGDELVDDDLRAVDEIAELRLPDDERVRLGAGIAVLEAEHRLLGEERVDDDERGLAVGDVLQRRVGAFVPALAVLVVQHGMSVRERAARRILAREANRVAARHQRRERE